MRDIKDIIENIQTLYNNNSSLNVLKDFERVLDEMDMYVYKNWKDGELASGPKVDRHWVTASFMWPKEQMPDPMAAKRLLDYGCKIKYEQTHLISPKKIENPDDFRPGTRKGKLDRSPIWIVEITMPKKLVEDTFNGYMTRMRESMGIGRKSQTEAVPQPAAPQAMGMAPAAAPAAPAPGGMPSAPTA